MKMPKAILELEMPESCLNCPCIAIDAWEKPKCRMIHTNNGLADAFVSSRRFDCPLKLVDKDILEKQKPKKVVETPDKYKYGYCPVCGRIYWDKSHVGNYCDQCGQRLEVEKE